ncbi:MAG: EamA-like transporter family protein [Lachnospiraceae bacterium]|nr:EamA-like transporter family protein [Lachnospiraceae bacterium]
MTKKNVRIFLVMQIMNVVFSLNTVLMKLASVSWQEEGLFAYRTIMILFAAVAVLGLYAVAWQAVLGKVDLSQAYLNKGTVVFWGLLWSAVIFHEQITPLNIIGSLIIFMGLLMVNYHE